MAEFTLPNLAEADPALKRVPDDASGTDQIVARIVARERERKASADVSGTDQIVARIVARERERKASAVMAAVNTVAERNPEEEVLLQRHAKVLGVPVDTLRVQPKEFQRQQAVVKANPQALAIDAPRTAEFLSDPNNAAVMYDDTKPLSFIERLVGPSKERINAADQRALAQQRGEIPLTDSVSPSVGTRPDAASVSTGLIKSLIRGSEQTKAGMRMQFADALNAAGVSYGHDEVIAQERRRFKHSQNLEAIDTPAFESDTVASVYGGTLSTLKILPAIAASLLTRSTAPVLTSAFVDTETQAYAKYRTRGATPGQALLGGVGEGAVEVLTEKMPMSFLVNKLGKTGFKEFVSGILLREGLTEQVATVLQDALDTAIANPDKTWGQYRQERPAAAWQTFIATITQIALLGGAHGVVRFLNKNQQKDNQKAAVLSTQETLAAISEAAKASTLQTRMPEKFEEFVAKAKDGGPFDTVYISAEQFQKYYQSQDIDPQAVANEVGATNYEEALAIGSDVAIPLEKYASQIAATKDHEGLAPDIRFHQGDLTLRELQEAPQAVSADVTQGAVSAPDVKQAKAFAIQEVLQEQLSKAGFEPSTANTYATIYSKTISTLAERAGIEPDVLHSRYGLTVTRDALKENPDATTFKQDSTKRGYIQFGKDRKFNIGLLDDANLSTFVHELSHFHLEILNDIATMPEANEQLKGDHQLLRDWLGAEAGAPFTEDQHETFARAGEAYLREGKAPSKELQGVFQRLRAWLELVYKSAAQLKVKLNDDVRGVFDRIYASDTEIEIAQKEMDLKPLFLDAKEAGMTDVEFAAYTKTVAQAGAKAKAALEKRLVQEYEREKTKAWKENREIIKREVEKEVNELPIYKAFEELISTEEFALKLSKKELQQRFTSEEVAKLPRGFSKAFTTDENFPIDTVAELLEFQSADELFTQLRDMVPKKQLIEDQTTARMHEKYGSLASDGRLPEAAVTALHNAERTNILMAELKALRRKRSEVRPFVMAERKAGKEVLREEKTKNADTLQDLKDKRNQDRIAARLSLEIPTLDKFRGAAVLMVSQTKYKELNPYAHLLAERKANRLAFKAMAVKDYDAANLQKQREVLNHYLYLESTKARDAGEATYKYMTKFDTTSVRQRIGKTGGNYLEQIDALREQYEFVKTSNVQLSRREGLATWVAAQEELGNRIDIDPLIVASSQQINYRQLTVAQLRALEDAVRNIAHLSSLKNKLLTQKAGKEFTEALNDAVQSIMANARNTRVDKIVEIGKLDAAISGLEGFAAIHRKLASLIYEMDGYKEDGVLWNLIVRPMNERTDFENVRRGEANRAMNEIFDPLFNDGGITTMVYIPEIKASLPRQARLTVALNQGNDTNKARLMAGEEWDQSQINAVLATLKQKDWIFVQKILDNIETYWPEIAAKEKRLTGLEPEHVEATPIVTPYGTLRGGYFPIVFDPRRSTPAQNDADAEAVKMQMQGAYSAATTKRGHTKARTTQDVKRPLKLDFNTIFQHLNSVVHDLAWHEWLIDTNRLLRSNKMDKAIRTTQGPAVIRTMKAAVENIAVGEVGAQNHVEQALSHLRNGTTVAALSYNLITAAVQPVGLAQTAHRIGLRAVLDGIQTWAGGAVHKEGLVKSMYERSPFMRLRGENLNRSLTEIRNKIAVDGKSNVLKDNYFIFIEKAQLLVDVPSWFGAYNKYRAEGKDEATAVALADQIVRDTQGTGNIADLAQIQHGSAYLKVFTNFYNFANVQLNLTTEAIGKTNIFQKEDGRTWGEYTKDTGRLAIDLLLLYSVPILWITALKGAFAGDDWEEYLKRVAKEHANSLLGLWVGVRELAAVTQGAIGYEGPAGTRAFSSIVRFSKQIAQNEADYPLVRSAIAVAGPLFHLPSVAIQRVGDTIVAYNEGRINGLQIPGSVIAGPPKP